MKISEIAGEVERYAKVREGEIRVGEPLPWNAYDSKDQLLLREGTIITSEKQLARLLAEGLYRKGVIGDRTKDELRARASKERGSPFVLTHEFTVRLKGILNSLQQGAKDVPLRVEKLARAIQELCERDADAALGAVHLDHEEAYTYRHSIHTALLSELVARRLGYKADRRMSLVAAALTSNAAMVDLQTVLVSQAEPLTPDQRKAVDEHPRRSAQILKDIGVRDPLWLQVVLQHHERIDGKGYPRGISGEQFIQDARLLALADRYHAMVTGRSYRGGLVPQGALRKIFLSVGEEVDEALAQVFIKELGVYPPGSFVRLNNGDIAVLIRRGKEVSTPVVSSIINAEGRGYMEPLQRDCSQQQYGVKELVTRPKSLSFNLARLWGYS